MWCATVLSVLLVPSFAAERQSMRPVQADQGRTWIVDASNGAGADFTDIEPAVDAAADGDVVLVRAGTYSSFGIQAKGLRVVAASATPMVQGSIGLRPVVAIRDLAAQQSVWIRGLQILEATENGYPGVAITDCAGTVHLENVSISHASRSALHASVDARAARLVTVSACVFGSTTAADRSTFAVSASSLRGRYAGGIDVFTWEALPALHLVRSRATVALTRLEGGDGINATFLPRPPAPAIVVDASVLAITGDAATVITVGRDPMQSGFGIPAIQGRRGESIVADPTMRFVTLNGAPPVGKSATGSLTLRRVVGLEAHTAPTGDALSGQIVSPTGDIVALLVGGPMLPLPTPIGDLFVERWLVPVAGSQDATEHFPFRVPVPNLTTLQRMPIALQAVNLYAASGALELSNPVVATVFP